VEKSQQLEIENLKLEGKMLAAEVRRLEEILRKKREENSAQAEEIKRLQKELQGIGVEQYYALQAKCREQEAEIRSLKGLEG
jgi:hypothetical protein